MAGYRKPKNDGPSSEDKALDLFAEMMIEKIESIQGEAPSPLDIPQGCPFQNRCPHCGERCRREKPQLVEVGPDHLVACHEVAERKKEGGGAA
mgnify:CR=1 FL=1